MKNLSVQINPDMIKPPVNEKSYDVEIPWLCDFNEIAALPLLRKSLGHGFMAERGVLAEFYIQIFPVDITHQAPAVQVWKFSAIRRMPDHQVII